MCCIRIGSDPWDLERGLRSSENEWMNECNNEQFNSLKMYKHCFFGFWNDQQISVVCEWSSCSLVQSNSREIRQGILKVKLNINIFFKTKIIFWLCFAASFILSCSALYWWLESKAPRVCVELLAVHLGSKITSWAPRSTFSSLNIVLSLKTSTFGSPDYLMICMCFSLQCFTYKVTVMKEAATDETIAKESELNVTQLRHDLRRLAIHQETSYCLIENRSAMHVYNFTRTHYLRKNGSAVLWTV